MSSAPLFILAFSCLVFLPLAHRDLASTIADSSMSQLIFPSSTQITVNSPVVFKVQARDSIGNQISTGWSSGCTQGSKFIIQIKNECTLDSNNKCVTVSDAQVVVDPEIQATMLDNADGTFTYSFTPTKIGKITVLVYLENTSNGVYAQFWNTIDLTGDIDLSCMYPNINKTWTSLVTTNQLSNTSGRMTTYISPPVNGTYTI